MMSVINGNNTMITTGVPMIDRLKTTKDMIDAAYGFQETALMELASFHRENFSNGPTPESDTFNFSGKDIIRLQGKIITLLKSTMDVRKALRNMEGPEDYGRRQSEREPFPS